MKVVGVELSVAVTVAHEVILPLVVKYLPALPDCEGKLDGKLVVVATRVSVMSPELI